MGVAYAGADQPQVNKDEIRKHVAEGRTCSDKNELGALTQWTEWVCGVKKAGHLGLDLAGELKGERVWWAADYVLFLFKVQKKREEELTRAVADIAAAFTTQLWDARMWGDKRVKSVVEAGKRNGEELAAKILRKAYNEKYDMNMEFMRKLFDHYRPDTVDWLGDPSTEEVDGALQFLLALCLLDIGMRVGMASPQAIGTERKTETSGQGAKAQEPGQSGADESEEEENGEGEREKETRQARSHEWKHKDCRYACWGKAGLEFMEGGEEIANFLKENGNDMVVFVQIWFDTSKTSHTGRSGPKVPKWATLGRRSDLESMALDLLVSYIRWNGPRSKEDPILRRKACISRRTGRKGDDRTTRSDDLTAVCKALGEQERVGRGHLSPICFRKGHACLMRALCIDELKAGEEAMVMVKTRASKWTLKSKVPERHYLANWDDRGPLARMTSWEHGMSLGPGISGWRLRQPPGQAQALQARVG